ncbi:RluA family pseudouridine synthase [Fodinicurvata fenggangensis]|uniref:RluA family pseudouridine synthase n=1 Tax=Fodinicurvata fenggangensis TaxID=1121830 RepID=UPI000691D0DC|nr:RluA family pseudouridine synthase [Fodinicurvata fenggangensis]
MVENRKIEDSEAEQRLDRWFKRHYPGLSHGRLEKLLRKGQVRVDGRRAKASTRLESGQVVRVPPLGMDSQSTERPKRSAPEPSAREAADLKARILYQDDWVMAIDKPAGLAVQGGSGQHRHLDGFLDLLQFEKSERPRLVHRLDRDTAGVLLLARTAEAARRLAASFKRDEPLKLYWALVVGSPDPDKGEIDLPLAKSGTTGREKMETQGADARSAVSRYATIARSGKQVTWLALRPLTGRTHQLRAHCSAIGHPILGDGKYGGRQAFPDKPWKPESLMLLAREITLPHPDDGTTLRVTAPLPSHFEAAFGKLGFQSETGYALKAADILGL